MTKKDYLAKLDGYLRRLPKKDYQEAMDYFTEYFDEVGPEGEAELMAELGSPKEAAHDLLRQLLDEKTKSSSTPKMNGKVIWIVLLSILAAPIGLPLLITILALIIAFILVFLSFMVFLAAISLTGFLLSAALIWETVTHFLTWSIFSVTIGSACLSLGLGLLLALLAFYASKYFVLFLVRLSQHLLKKITKEKSYV